MRLYIVFDKKTGKPARLHNTSLRVFSTLRAAKMECKWAREYRCDYEVREYDATPPAGKGE